MAYLGSGALAARALILAVLTSPLILAVPAARAADILVVLDSGSDMGIATALMADGHTITIRSDMFAGGTNPALTGDLSAYDVIFWSQDGTGGGDAVTDPALFTNLNAWVMAGGRILVTGYDSVASPDDPMLIAFLGATTSSDVVGPPGAIAMIDNSLTTGMFDIRGVTPTGGVGDTDHMNGLMADTVAVTPSASGTGTQWTLRMLGAGEIAYMSNGSSSGSWTNTAAGGAGAYNAAIRNFAGAAGSACMGEGTACTSSGGAMGLCRMGRCCTGCWDGTRCRPGNLGTVCGARGVMCASCADGDLCSSDVCTAGVCSNPDAPSGTACDDGVFCTRTDTCNATGTCMGRGARCDDSETCTVDSCDEAMDRCNNVGMADSTACTAGMGGTPGLCRASRCCTGCWTGTVCEPGVEAAFCGVRGGMCRSCVDTVSCSLDVCTAGACSNPDSPSGSPCDDGMFCTPTDRCNATRTCIGTGVRCNDGASCTVDTCNEAMDACVFTPGMGCIIGGVCVGEGTVNPSYPCQVCDPARDDSDWSARAVGTECGPPRCSVGRYTTRACNAAGTCASTTMPCPEGACADATTCGAACTADSCGPGMWCSPTTRTCMMLGDPGDSCVMAAACASGACVDGVCCNEACDGTCEVCDSPVARGTCRPITAGTDPDRECGTSTCDGAGGCTGIDAGPEMEDAGSPQDGGTDDGGAAADAGSVDSGILPPIDAAARDGGRGGGRDGGCGCSVPAATGEPRAIALVVLAALGLLLGRRARRRGRER
jgi:hypothetical protein